MDQLPVLEPAGKLPGLEQKIGIVRTSVSGLFGGEGFINQDSSFPYSLFQTGNQGAMKVAEDQDASIVFLFQRVYAGFEIDLPENHIKAFPLRRLFGLGQGFSGSIGQNHRKTQPGQEETIFPLTASQIQNRAFKVFFLQERGESLQ
jgi:hypothetical protein